MNDTKIIQLIEKNKLNELSNLKNFIINSKNHYSLEQLSRIIELTNAKRETHSAYYTNDFIIEEIIKELPDFHEKQEINIIEPSVGIGKFLPFLFKKYLHVPKVNLFLIDIDEDVLSLLNLLYQDDIPKNFHIQIIHQDFLIENNQYVDLIIGNPPFTKLTQKQIKSYLNNDINCANLSGLFLYKAIQQADYVSLILPKNLLNTKEYELLRHSLKKMNVQVQQIMDFGELGFKGVLVETINLIIKTESSTDQQYTKITSLPRKITLNQKSNYIFDEKLPYWIIYRNDFFDKIFYKLTFDVFDVFRDRQITNSNTQSEQTEQSIRVIKSRNINNTGEHIVNIPNYDTFIQANTLELLSVRKYLNRDDVYLTPNMTYNPRVMRKQKGYVVNGSVAILIPKTHFLLTTKQMIYFASDEFRQFYRIARNYQTRSLNIDKNSVYWFGINNNMKQ
jgi:M2.hin4II m6A DNA methyltransferase